MMLTISAGTIYADNLQLSFARPGNGRTDFPVGRYEVTTQYSPAHEQELPLAVGLGWIGPAIDRDAPECDVVLGRVRGSDGLLPCANPVGRLLALLEVAADRGQASLLVIE